MHKHNLGTVLSWTVLYRTVLRGTVVQTFSLKYVLFCLHGASGMVSRVASIITPYQP